MSRQLIFLLQKQLPLNKTVLYCQWFLFCYLPFFFANISVPRKVLQNQFNVSEADEQLHSDVENEQDEFYNDDQVYVGNEAPKLQAPPSHTTASVNDSITHRPSNTILITQPKQKSNEETLEGMCGITLYYFVC